MPIFGQYSVLCCCALIHGIECHASSESAGYLLVIFSAGPIQFQYTSDSDRNRCLFTREPQVISFEPKTPLMPQAPMRCLEFEVLRRRVLRTDSVLGQHEDLSPLFGVHLLRARRAGVLIQSQIDTPCSLSAPIVVKCFWFGHIRLLSAGSGSPISTHPYIVRFFSLTPTSFFIPKHVFAP